MSNTWQKAYSELKEYIAGNPKVEIGKDVIAIPGDNRKEFYAMFDRIREAFIRDFFFDGLSDSEELSREFKAVAQEVTSSLGVEGEVELNPKLKWLIDNPLNGLIRPLYDPLFDLLKGKIDEETFMEKGFMEVQSALTDLYHKGYDRWIILTLVKWLEPSSLLCVPQKEPNAINCLTELYKQGERIEPVPNIKKASRLSFEPGTWDTFIVPDLIIYSNRLNKYVGLRTSLPTNTDEPYLTAKQITSKREWLPFSELKHRFILTNPWPNILVYIDENPKNIKLIADFKYMLRPDLVVNTMPEDNWFNLSTIDWIKSHNEHLKPFTGTVVLCRRDAPEDAFKALEPVAVQLAPEEAQNEVLAESAEMPEGDIDIFPVTAAQDQPETPATQVTGEQEAMETGKPEEVETAPTRPVIRLISAGFDQNLVAKALEVFIPPDSDDTEPARVISGR